ncbi:MAG: sensor histidine kinase [Anaerolineales bacterium]
MSAAPDSSSSIPPPARREAWERWVIIWHVVFYISLAVPTILALLAEELNRSQLSVLGFSLALAIWYGLIMVWIVPRARGKYQLIWSIIYLAGAILLWFPLARTHWAYFITASSFYGLMWGTLPFGLAVAGNVILTAVIIWIQALNLGRSVTLSAELFLIGAVVIGWAALLALWMRTIMRESAARKLLIEQLEAAQEELAAVERRAGILQERQRMAQEIHDTLAQGFTSIVMQLEAADQALPDDVNGARRHLLTASDTARANLAEARRLVMALQPEQLEIASLPDALRREAARWEKDTGLNTVFSVTGEPVALHPEIEVTLLRAMQEGLTNIRKHAQASEIVVTLSYMDEQVALDVQDDGQGFDPQTLGNAPDQVGGGFGLRAMRQRAEYIGGSVIVESSPGQGTTLVLQLPIVNEIHHEENEIPDEK